MDHVNIAAEKGKVFAFGWGEFGILGNGGNDNALRPTLIPGLSSITSIATGYKHAAALSSMLYVISTMNIYLIKLSESGEVFVFGEDTYGSLGISQADIEVESPSMTIENILPSTFETIAPSPPDPAAVARNATIEAWKIKGINLTTLELNLILRFRNK